MDSIKSSRISLLMALLASQFCNVADSANILFYHHIASYSHRVVTYPLADALAKRGHQITFLSPFHPRGPYINPNVTEIVPEKMAATMEAFLANDFDINFRIQKQLPSNVFAFYPTGIVACQDLLESKELKQYLEKTTALDLIIMDDCLTECGMGIAYKYGAKHITFNTVALIASESDIYGIIPESSAIPEVDLFAPQPPMTFLERVKNALTSIYFRYIHYTWYIPQIDQLIRQNMGHQEMPFVDDLFRNTSLVLYMGDPVTDYSRSFPPLFVNVGGIHCKDDANDLPKELESFVEGGKDGFVYISLGSIVVSSNLPDNIKEAFFQTISSFPKLRFLWKWNGEFPKSFPENLFLAKWFPQNDILAHPSLKAFITQSGRPSTQEALCAAVPMIALPVLGDQDTNANRMNEMGGNVLMEVGTLNKDQLQNALETVVYQKAAKERMVELRNILNDQPMSPLDRAVWWTEYVLRHKNTNHLKPAGFNQWWYERRLLDVWAFIFSMILISLIVLVLATVGLVKCLLKLLGTNRKSGEGQDKTARLKKKE